MWLHVYLSPQNSEGQSRRISGAVATDYWTSSRFSEKPWSKWTRQRITEQNSPKSLRHIHRCVYSQTHMHTCTRIAKQNSSSPLQHIHRCVHSQTHMHTCTRIAEQNNPMSSSTHTHVCTHRQTHMHTFTRIVEQSSPSPPQHIHGCVHSQTNTHAHTHKNNIAEQSKSSSTHTQVCVHTDKHTCTHTHINTYSNWEFNQFLCFISPSLGFIMWRISSLLSGWLWGWNIFDTPEPWGSMCHKPSIHKAPTAIVVSHNTKWVPYHTAAVFEPDKAN